MAVKQGSLQGAADGVKGMELLRQWLKKSRPNLSIFRSVKIRIGLGILGFFLFLALCGPLLVHQDPQAFGPDVLSSPSATHWLGTTQTGQDVFAQVIDGARMTMLVGFVVGALATTLSVVIGLTAGYFGGV